VGTATAGAGLWGQLDLAGNLDQWNLDWYAGSYIDPCADCVNLVATTASDRVLRGGSYLGASARSAPARGFGGLPTGSSYDLGFRCARTP
jgi:formylglycine-generating enzyme required for sulfatase activity